VPIKKFYEGTLRVPLVLLHDSLPSFLAAYHFTFCNAGELCAAAHIVLGNTEGNFSSRSIYAQSEDRLASEISQSPVILSECP
jgi:hypothetical protein